MKLRGVCRHDVHPQTGRAITPELVEQDVRSSGRPTSTLCAHRTIRRARISWRPVTAPGSIVEDEIAVAFVYQGIQPTENDPDFTPAYMNQFAEMIERDREPSVRDHVVAGQRVVLGAQFPVEYDYARAEDPSAR